MMYTLLYLIDISPPRCIMSATQYALAKHGIMNNGFGAYRRLSGR